MHLPGLDRFLAVAQAGSLNKAAEKLHISQPALTKSIQVLEDRLGVPLFVRAARGVTLTTYGKAVLMRARAIDAEMRKIGEDILALQDLASGSVNVGAPPGAGFHSSILPAVTLRLIAGDRKLSVNYTMGTREQLLPAVREGGWTSSSRSSWRMTPRRTWCSCRCSRTATAWSFAGTTLCWPGRWCRRRT